LSKDDQKEGEREKVDSLKIRGKKTRRKDEGNVTKGPLLTKGEGARWREANSARKGLKGWKAKGRRASVVKEQDLGEGLSQPRTHHEIKIRKGRKGDKMLRRRRSRRPDVQ